MDGNKSKEWELDSDGNIWIEIETHHRCEWLRGWNWLWTF